MRELNLQTQRQKDYGSPGTEGCNCMFSCGTRRHSSELVHAFCMVDLYQRSWSQLTMKKGKKQQYTPDVLKQTQLVSSPAACKKENKVTRQPVRSELKD